MNKIRLLLKYIEPYKWSAFKNIIYNILSAIFALVSYTLVIPFLKILFNHVEPVPHPGEFVLSIDYLDSFSKYYLSTLSLKGMVKRGRFFSLSLL